MSEEVQYTIDNIKYTFTLKKDRLQRPYILARAIKDGVEYECLIERGPKSWDSVIGVRDVWSILTENFSDTSDSYSIKTSIKIHLDKIVILLYDNSGSFKIKLVNDRYEDIKYTQHLAEVNSILIRNISVDLTDIRTHIYYTELYLGAVVGCLVSIGLFIGYRNRD